MTRILTAAIAAISLLATGTLLADDSDEAGPATLDELKAAITALVAENELPAAAIAIVDRDGPLWVDAIGKSSLEDDVDADADSMFRIGSTSKMFVALAVLKLVEEGRLSLDDRVADLAPDVAFENPWAGTDPIRVVHLLEHTTGWDDFHLPEYAHNDAAVVTLKQGIDFHPHSRVSRWKPGSRMSYCNAGPPVAAYIVEKITGIDFEDYVKQNLFDPMGMDTMTYRLSDDVRQKGVTLYANGNQPQPYWHILMRPSGSINASARDMARMVSFFVNRGAVDGQQILSRSSIDRMETTESTTGAAAGLEVGYGLNNYASPHDSFVYRAHDGGMIGAISEFAYLPQAGIGHAIMTNSDDFQTFMEISNLLRDFETRNLAKPPPATPVGAPPPAIAGIYYPINPRQQVAYFLDRVLGVQALRVEGDKLLYKALLGGEAREFIPVSSTLFRDAETGEITLARAVDPLAGPVLHLGTMVLRPVSPLIAYGQLVIGALWGLAIVTSLLYFVVWGIRKLRGKIPPGATIRMRLWPLLAGASVLGTVSLFSVAFRDPFARLGAPTLYSIGIMVFTIAFAVFAFLGVRTALREKNTPMNRVNYWYCASTSAIHLAVAAYLLWFGIIGLMTWA